MGYILEELVVLLIEDIEFVLADIMIDLYLLLIDVLAYFILKTVDLLF